MTQGALALACRWQGDRALAQAHAVIAAHESRAIHLANHDPLTEAPNRLAFHRALGEWARTGARFAVAILGLDRLKLVNDTYGLPAGDELLRLICSVLRRNVSAGGMVARLGGDEFGVVFDTAAIAAADEECARLVAACSGAYKVLGNTVQCGASIGLIVANPGEARDPTDLIRRAVLALDHAKRDGRGVVRLFDDRMDDDVRVRRAIENGLGQAIAKSELTLVYQPIVARERLEVVGFEALVRWDSEAHGPISPDIFVPVAEQSDLIHALGDWVLREALKALAEWPGQYVSINVSPRQFRRKDFVARLAESVRNAGVDPGRVQIEITETSFFDNADRAAETLLAMRQMGFRIALDDFGTGYSSLFNIRKFPLDCLKIDRSFIDGMGVERESAAIVHAIIHLGRALGLGVVAEGVETDAQVQTLRCAGCSHMQGNYLSRPVARDMARDVAEARYRRAPPPSIVQPVPRAGSATGTRG